ncbi:MAG: homoserine dehydrogenase [Clostridia bacterium]|nr:homoserine dehydrogenase [Clostridia bacterium]
MISIAILGHGVVGSGVAEIILNHADELAAKAGQPVTVGKILDLRTFPALPYAHLFTQNVDDILQDDSIAIVVETMGGLHPAYDFVKAALLAGKSVVTSNKALVAAFGDELLAIAKEKNLNFLFEASVGGGIPILRPLHQCLAANRVEEIAGILNGTTNFMLTKMFAEGMSFDEALALAQQLGYAERDPSADVEGHDACRKICILASLAFGKHIRPEEIHTEGITKISARDVQCAAALDGVIKLIGRVKPTADGHLHCLVAPMVVANDNLLAGVNDVYNAIMVRGDSVEDVVFVGRGAGKLPTASAVVADVIDEVHHMTTRKPLFWGPAEDGFVQDSRQAAVRMLVRVTCTQPDEAKKAIADAFGQAEWVSVGDAPAEELVFITPCMAEQELEDTLSALSLVTVESRLRLFA